MLTLRSGLPAALALATLAAGCDATRSLDESSGGGGHGVPFLDQHPAAAVAGIQACAACHGVDYGGTTAAPSCNACHGDLGYADWKTNCTFCHGTRTPGWTDANLPLAAPPQSVAGATDRSDPKVGAHQAHLASGLYASALPCASCHAVPPRAFPGSLDHVDGAAAIQFSATAQLGVSGAAYANGTCAVYCHGSGTLISGGSNTTPAWTSVSGLACNSCHGGASPNPVAPDTGRHKIAEHSGQPCGRCHATVANTLTPPSILNTAAAKALHVNGQRDVSFSVSGAWDSNAKTCSNIACHGGTGTRPWY